jgi:hypothetical protein
MRELEKDEIRQILELPAITPADALKVLPISRNGLYEAIRRGEIKSVWARKSWCRPARCVASWASKPEPECSRSIVGPELPLSGAHAADQADPNSELPASTPARRRGHAVVRSFQEV